MLIQEKVQNVFLKSWATVPKAIKKDATVVHMVKNYQNHRTKLGRNNQMYVFDVSEEQETTKAL